jgi:GH25 family lysozyme M1 (1,4-beta-N-acetylmuramidase)
MIREAASLAALVALVVVSFSAAPAAAAEGSGYAGWSIDAPIRQSAATQQPVGAVPGIDVSRYQGTIDWAQVAASGQRFVIAKATEGLFTVDPTYATNRAGAMAAGLVFGAYHFARPDLHPNDPIGEADHFVDTAQLGPGNIVPVLDLERSGDLTQAQLTAWILAWLGEVAARTGVRPMVYTSPNGWANRTGDTTAVADAGYTLLWIANWFVLEPTVPANDWQGNGWAFWQYSNCGTVPGISGCVDLDWYKSSDFTPVTMPSSDTTVPAPTITSFAPISGPVGTSVVITGTNLTGVTEVRFENTNATTFTVDSNTQITAVVPSGAQTGKISVTAPWGTATSSSNFTVTAAGSPTITSFSPMRGPAGTSVTIVGTNFTGTTSVKFGGAASTNFTVSSSTQIAAVVPTGARTGPITVTNASGTGTSATNFTVLSTFHDRTISLALRRHLVARGNVNVSDGFAACHRNVRVRIQRRDSGEWRTIDATLTNDTGFYRERIPDRAGRYRAVAPRVERANDVCRRAVSAVVRNA